MHNPRRPPIVGSPTNPDNSTAALTAHMTSNKEWVPEARCSTLSPLLHLILMWDFWAIRQCSSPLAHLKPSPPT